jgi:cytochrome c peroxidase
MKKYYFILLLLSCLFISCSDSEDSDYTSVPDTPEAAIINLPDTPYNYSNPDFPEYFFINDSGVLPSSVNNIDNTPTTNPVTNAGATLGRVLFYDKNLSTNKTTACGSCHRQEKAFADSSPFSHGLFGGATRRNSMTMINTRFYKRGHFFYDERANTLEDQVLMPIVDQTEMGLSLTEIAQRVAAQPYYAKLFTAAFGNSHVTNDLIADALSQFVRSMVSYESKYDTGRAQVANMRDPFPNFTASENRGKDLFLKPFADGGVNCFSCHTTEAFVSPNGGPLNNGLDLASTIDLGAFEFSQNASQKGAFKIPTLRNIALTAPYMHDARFNTLAQVIEHYNSGVKNHPNLAPGLKGNDGLPRQLNLSEADKLALVLFLNTLTDPTIFSGAKYSDPFINQHL